MKWKIVWALRVLAAILVGLADRVRGGFPEGNRPKWVAEVAKAIVGPGLVFMVSSDLTAICAAIVVGNIGWRQDNGWRGQWVNPAEWKGLYSIWRALQWGLAFALVLCAITAWFDKATLVYFVALPIGSLIGISIGRLLPQVATLELRHGWPWSELITLTIVSGLAICTKFLVSSQWPSLLI